MSGLKYMGLVEYLIQKGWITDLGHTTELVTEDIEKWFLNETVDDAILEAAEELDLETQVSVSAELLGYSNDPTVLTVNTEIATFSDKSLVLRQRSYMNRSFASLRNKHEILTPDVFRMVFKVGRTLSETLKYFAHPELMEDESQVDGDPGDSRKRMLRP